MSQELDRQEITIRYLLGDLTEEEKSRLEEHYFLDDEEFERLEIAEDELIDKYVREELSADDTRRFEKLLVSPGLSERVEVARLLVKPSAQVSQVVPAPAVSTVPLTPVRGGWWDWLVGPAAAIPAFRPAFAMSLIFLMLTTTALVFVWMKQRTESQRFAQEQQQQREELRRRVEEESARYRELEAKLTKTQQEKDEQAALLNESERRLAEALQRSTPGFTLAVSLNPGGGTRGPGGEAIRDISIRSGASQVRFTLNVTHGGDDYSRYNAVLQNIDTSQQIATKPNLKPVTEGGHKYIKFNLDATKLRAGSYNVHVDGVTPTGQTDPFDEYPFRVKAR